MDTEKLLQNYHLLCDCDSIEFKEILWDLSNAIERAGLSDIERRVIEETYLKPPMPPPVRTGRRGKPKGGTTGITVALALHDELRKTVRPINRAKVGEYNHLHRSIKQYKKVLNVAIEKINTALNYGGSDGTSDPVSPPTLWYLYPRNIHQI